ncbi:hypothetical protein, partial [Paenibacillus xylanexedens]|uniref:hypothetical protein n=1 Tax=Paenibacillus xylanexedens TaxID=528191 RepID=UPI0016430DD1
GMRDYVGVEGRWNGEGKRLRVRKVKENNVRVKGGRVKGSVKNGEVDMEYGEVRGVGNDKGEGGMKKVVKDETDGFVGGLKKEGSEYGAAS